MNKQWMMMFTTVLYLLETYKLEGETENMGVCTKERKGVTAKELMGHSLYDDDDDDAIFAGQNNRMENGPQNEFPGK
jgi:hypothetical protein